jgi:hypothetical protein
MAALNGKYNYQSFVANAAVADRSAGLDVPPKVIRPPQIAAVWTPASIMEFSTDESGVVTGSASLVMRDVTLQFKIDGKITAAEAPILDRAANPLPEGVELTITIPGTRASYRLRGYFLKDSDHVVGTVVAISGDLGLQPDGTSGPFILYPAK